MIQTFVHTWTGWECSIFIETNVKRQSKGEQSGIDGITYGQTGKKDNKLIENRKYIIPKLKKN